MSGLKPIHRKSCDAVVFKSRVCTQNTTYSSLLRELRGFVYVPEREMEEKVQGECFVQDLVWWARIRISVDCGV